MFNLDLGSNPGKPGVFIARDHESSLSYGGRGIQCLRCQTHSVSSEPLPRTAFVLSCFPPILQVQQRGETTKKGWGGGILFPPLFHKAEVTRENQIFHPRKHTPCLSTFVRSLPRTLLTTTPAMVLLGTRTSLALVSFV